MKTTGSPDTPNHYPHPFPMNTPIIPIPTACRRIVYGLLVAVLVLAAGWHTADTMGCEEKLVGCKKMGSLICAELEK